MEAKNDALEITHILLRSDDVACPGTSFGGIWLLRFLLGGLEQSGLPRNAVNLHSLKLTYLLKNCGWKTKFPFGIVPALGTC